MLEKNSPPQIFDRVLNTSLEYMTILWARFDKKVPLNFDKWSVKKEGTEAATGHVL